MLILTYFLTFCFDKINKKSFNEKNFNVVSKGKMKRKPNYFCRYSILESSKWINLVGYGCVCPEWQI